MLCDILCACSSAAFLHFFSCFMLSNFLLYDPLLHVPSCALLMPLVELTEESMCISLYVLLVGGLFCSNSCIPSSTSCMTQLKRPSNVCTSKPHARACVQQTITKLMYALNIMFYVNILKVIFHNSHAILI